MLQIDQFRTFFRDAIQGGILQGGQINTIENLRKILMVNFPWVPDMVVHDGGYYVETPITLHANTGAFSVTVDEDLYFEQNDSVTLVSKDTRDMQIMTLNGGPVNKQLNFLTPLTVPYKEGSVVRMFKPYIPDGRIYFFPEWGPSVPALGKTFLCPSEWAPGQLTAPRPGIFFETHEHLTSDPKRIELISGFEGITVPQYLGMHAILQAYPV